MLAAGRPVRPAPAIDVVEASRVAAAGKPNPFTLNRAPTPFVRPKVSTPVGLFGGIEHAGPKPRKKAEPKPPKAGAKSLKSLFGIDSSNYAPNSKVADAHRRAGVPESFELTRILEIPRRPSDLGPYASGGERDLTSVYARPGGKMKLWPIQSAALTEAPKVDGLLGPIGVGHGKALITLLMPAAMKARMAVILIPPSLRDQTMSQVIPEMAKHWFLPLANLRVVAYSEISNHRSADILEEIKPDLIVADEVHALKNRSAARTKRFLRYMKEHPECRFVGLSGTITRKSLKDYQHLSELALKKYSPLPRSWADLADWSEAIDVSDDPMPPGALRQLCTPEECARIDDPEVGSNDAKAHAAHEAVRAGFRRRLVETPGVVATEEGALGTSLVLHGVRPLVPSTVNDALQKLRFKWEIGGEELTDALAVSRVGRQLASGFYYKWVWPKEIRPDGTPDNEWLEARAAWHKEVREIIKLSRKGLDSPFLVTKAVLDGKYQSDAYQAWHVLKDRYAAYPNGLPPRESVWLSEFVVDAAIAWAEKHATKAQPAIIWYQWQELGEKIAARGKFPFFGGGPTASRDLALVDVKKTPVIVASIKAHGTGKNLQAFSQNLIVNTPSAGAEWEQLLARTHRPGQEADEVSGYVLLHTLETSDAFATALNDARYIEQTQGQKQKLNYARRVGC